jgi:nucleoside-diphosphate-sugar epimerase
MIPLVTGAAGFVAGALMQLLVQKRTRCSAHADLVSDIREIRADVKELLNRGHS